MGTIKWQAIFLKGRELLLHAEDEVLRSSRRGDDAVGHRLLQFRFSGACFLRDREVFLESIRAADRHGATYPYQFPIFDIENFFILIVQDLLADLHGQPPFNDEKRPAL